MMAEYGDLKYFEESPFKTNKLTNSSGVYKNREISFPLLYRAIDLHI
jgi:hypothetical protein